MSSPIWTVRDIPVFQTQGDLEADGQEHGNMAVTVTPATLWIWFTPTGWTAVTSTTTVELAERVTRIEGRLACLAECLTDG